jgi:hypothetical protein
MSHGIGFLVVFVGGADTGVLLGGSVVEVPAANRIPVEIRAKQRREPILFFI